MGPQQSGMESNTSIHHASNGLTSPVADHLETVAKLNGFRDKMLDSCGVNDVTVDKILVKNFDKSTESKIWSVVENFVENQNSVDSSLVNKPVTSLLVDNNSCDITTTDGNTKVNESNSFNCVEAVSVSRSPENKGSDHSGNSNSADNNSGNSNNNSGNPLASYSANNNSGNPSASNSNNNSGNPLASYSANNNSGTGSASNSANNNSGNPSASNYANNNSGNPLASNSANNNSGTRYAALIDSSSADLNVENDSCSTETSMINVERTVPHKSDSGKHEFLDNYETAKIEDDAEAMETVAEDDLADDKLFLCDSSDNDELDVVGEISDKLEHVNDIHGQTDAVPEQMELVPEEVDCVPEHVNDIHGQTDDVQEQMELVPEEVDGVPEHMVDKPGQVDGVPEEMRDVPEEMDGIPEDMRDVPEEMRDVPEEMDGIPEDMRDVPEEMKDVPEEMRDVPEEMRDVPEEMRDVEEHMDNIPEQMEDVPEQMDNLDKPEIYNDLKSCDPVPPNTSNLSGPTMTNTSTPSDTTLTNTSTPSDTTLINNTSTPYDIALATNTSTPSDTTLATNTSTPSDTTMTNTSTPSDTTPTNTSTPSDTTLTNTSTPSDTTMTTPSTPSDIALATNTSTPSDTALAANTSTPSDTTLTTNTSTPSDTALAANTSTPSDTTLTNTSTPSDTTMTTPSTPYDIALATNTSTPSDTALAANTSTPSDTTPTDSKTPSDTTLTTNTSTLSDTTLTKTLSEPSLASPSSKCAPAPVNNSMISDQTPINLSMRNTPENQTGSDISIEVDLGHPTIDNQTKIASSELNSDNLERLKQSNNELTSSCQRDICSELSVCDQSDETEDEKNVVNSCKYVDISDKDVERDKTVEFSGPKNNATSHKSEPLSSPEASIGDEINAIVNATRTVNEANKDNDRDDDVLEVEIDHAENEYNVIELDTGKLDAGFESTDEILKSPQSDVRERKTSEVTVEENLMLDDDDQLETSGNRCSVRTKTGNLFENLTSSLGEVEKSDDGNKSVIVISDNAQNTQPGNSTEKKFSIESLVEKQTERKRVASISEGMDDNLPDQKRFKQDSEAVKPDAAAEEVESMDTDTVVEDSMSTISLESSFDKPPLNNTKSAGGKTTFTKSDVAKIVQSRLNFFLTLEMEKVTSPLRKRVQELKASNDAWKNKAIDLERKITQAELLLRQQEINAKHNRKVSTRSIGLQVDNTKVYQMQQAVSKLPTPQKSPPIMLPAIRPNLHPVTVTGANQPILRQVAGLQFIPSSATPPSVANLAKQQIVTSVASVGSPSAIRSSSVREILQKTTIQPQMLTPSRQFSSMIPAQQRVVGTATTTLTTTTRQAAPLQVIDLTDDDPTKQKIMQGSNMATVRNGTFTQAGLSQVRPLQGTPVLRPGTTGILLNNGQTVYLQQIPRPSTAAQSSSVSATAAQPTIIYQQPPPGGNTQIRPPVVTLLQQQQPQTINSNTVRPTLVPVPAPSLVRPLGMPPVSVNSPLPRPHVSLRPPANSISMSPSLQPKPSLPSPKVPVAATVIPSSSSSSAASHPPSKTVAKHPAPLPSHPNTTNDKSLPPKPGLKISRVSQGIVLSWNMNISTDQEDISRYQLYAYQETSAPPSTNLWKRVGDVKALPLPMACTLTQFQEGNRYHFAVRAIDSKNRVGAFSDPSSIHLQPASSS